MPPIHAHSSRDASSAWELLVDHLAHVAAASEERAQPIGLAALGRLAGLLHDIGKCSTEFQAYLRSADGSGRGPDHSTAGAIEALRLYPGPVGRMLSFVIAGHHAGLADGDDLLERLGKTLPIYAGWEMETGPLPEAAALAPTRRIISSAYRGYTSAFMIRMLFSCLVDADFVATESFYATGWKRNVTRDGFTSLAALHVRLQAFMAVKQSEAPDRPINALRAAVLHGVTSKAELAPGLFTLTVPTGGGKTLASLSFALAHAIHHRLRRVIYVIPFTSVIEQAADVFRKALAAEPGGENRDDVLEHHASFDWEAGRRQHEDGRGPDPLDRLRRAAENWAAPIIVTTAVQFFESLHANRTSRCRKLHNLANSVIVLDEAQTLPLRLLRPCLAALDELARNYGVSIVLCTATQPALRAQDGFVSGLDLPVERELAPDPDDLFARLRRVAIERHDGVVTDETIAARFAAQPQMLCVVNMRAHAQALFGAIRDMPGAIHLSTLMCPAHRRAMLAEARRRLGVGEPVRIVSTSLIEAGVDMDLPEVWRAAAGLDSIAHGGADRNFRFGQSGTAATTSPPHGGADRNSENIGGTATNWVASSRGRGSKLCCMLFANRRRRSPPPGSDRDCQKADLVEVALFVEKVGVAAGVKS